MHPEEQPDERGAFRCADPGPDGAQVLLRRGGRRGEAPGQPAGAAAASLGQDGDHQLLLAAEVVEQHPRTGVERRGRRAQAQPGQAVRQDVVGRPREGGLPAGRAGGRPTVDRPSAAPLLTPRQAGALALGAGGPVGNSLDGRIRPRTARQRGGSRRGRTDRRHLGRRDHRRTAGPPARTPADSPPRRAPPTPAARRPGWTGVVWARRSPCSGAPPRTRTGCADRWAGSRSPPTPARRKPTSPGCTP